MKAKRHAKILELIEEFDIDPQEELQDRLNQAGFTVTQATVSRDIKELRLIKTLSPNGNYRYTTHGEKGGRVDLSFKFHAIFAEAVNSIDYAQNLVVISATPVWQTLPVQRSTPSVGTGWWAPSPGTTPSCW